MTRPTVLDMDLVVVPREATDEMLSSMGDMHMPFGEMVAAYDGAIFASPYPTAWDDVRKYVEGLEARLVAVAGPCILGVGCEQYGVCYADAHGKPEECGKPSFECEALKDARRIADHDKKLWLAAESRIAELEKRLADAERVIEPFAKAAQEIDDRFYSETGGQGPLGGDNFVTIMPLGDEWEVTTLGHLRAARAYMEGK